jgi:hypothetical protein
MASDGARVFVLGGYSKGAQEDEISLIHVFDTSMYIRFVNLSGQLSKLRTQSTSSTRNPSVILLVLTRRPSNMRGSHPLVPDPGATRVNNKSIRVLEDEGSTEYYAKFAAPHFLKEKLQVWNLNGSPRYRLLY